MNNKEEIKLLCISTKTWMNKNAKKFCSNAYIYNFELLSKSEEEIKQRLTHNSYDILLIDYTYMKKHIKSNDPLIFSKLAYAMARPSIIICNSIFQYLMLKFLVFHNTFWNKFKTSKELIHIHKLSDISTNLKTINTSKYYHSYIKKISNEIYTVFINE